MMGAGYPEGALEAVKYSPEGELARASACPTFAGKRLAGGGAGGFARELCFFSAP
jgi:hypothetical protein